MTTHQDHDHEAWQRLKAVMPMVNNLKKPERKGIMGAVRQSLIWAQSEEKRLTTILDLKNTAALEILVHSLEVVAPETLENHLNELDLSPEESEQAAIDWAFRNQSHSGEFLIAESLVAFQLIRAQENFYLLLADSDYSGIPDAFSGVFRKPPDLFFATAFQNQEKAWKAWAWFICPDPVQTREITEKMRSLWQAMEKQ